MPTSVIRPSSLVVFSQAGPPAPQLIIWIALAGILLVLLTFLVVLAKYFRLWLMASMSGANVSLIEIVTMKLHRTDPGQLVPLKIMAVQAGVDVPLADLERGALNGVDVERAVLAMIHAKQTGREVSWEELVQADTSERLEDRRTG